MEKLARLHLANLHITSRLEFGVRAVLQLLTFRSVPLHDQSEQKADIINSVWTIVDSDAKIRKWHEEVNNLVVETLS